MSHETTRAEPTAQQRAERSRILRDDRRLWVVPLVALVLDVLTTVYGLQHGLTELNPVVLSLVPSLGILWTLLLLKAFVLAVGITMWRLLPLQHRAAVPLGVAVPWGIAGLLNAQLILSTVFA
ncbi:DUF5658 family protein [Haloferax namakaokahaiae]|uniref:DUF5658 family protein n=1 Tax=Haloferax namakaokahaiae TaxID=1748331 RepID=A0ABD5ZEL2_9EURY